MEAFGYPVVFREAEHPGDLLLPQLQRAPKGTHSLEWALAKLVYAGQKPRYKGSTSKTGAKEFWGGHSGTIFSSLSAEDADTQAVVFKIPEAVRSSLDELHFPVEAFGNPVIFREAEHPGNLFLP